MDGAFQRKMEMEDLKIILPSLQYVFFLQQNKKKKPKVVYP